MTGRHIAGVLAALFALGSANALDLRRLVEETALAAAQLQVATPDRFEPLAVRIDGPAAPPAGEVRLELAGARGPNAAGIVELRFRLLAGASSQGEVRALVRGIVRGPALVARELLPGGRPIEAHAVESREQELTGIGGSVLRDAAEIGGRAPVRTLAAGRILRSDLLRSMPVVRHGETVDLYVRRAGVTVSAKGLVKRDGTPGDTVLAENTATGTRLLARVQADGSLLVLRPAPVRPRR